MEVFVCCLVSEKKKEEVCRWKNESKGWIDDPLANVTVVFEYFPMVSILSSMDFWIFIILIFAFGFSIKFKSLAKKPIFFLLKILWLVVLILVILNGIWVYQCLRPFIIRIWCECILQMCRLAGISDTKIEL